MFKRKFYAKTKIEFYRILYFYRIYSELNVFNRIQLLRCTVLFSSYNTYIKAVKK